VWWIASRIRNTVRNVGARLPFLKVLILTVVRQRVSAPLYSLAMPDSLTANTWSQRSSLLFSGGCKRVLFVGCRMEQTGYWAQFEQLGVEVWSVDIDPAVARFGVPGRHFVGDATELQAIASLPDFDCIAIGASPQAGADRASRRLGARPQQEPHQGRLAIHHCRCNASS